MRVDLEEKREERLWLGCKIKKTNKNHIRFFFNLAKRSYRKSYERIFLQETSTELLFSKSDAQEMLIEIVQGD